MVVASPIGNIKIEDNGSAIVKVELTDECVSAFDASSVQLSCADQLDEYFRGERTKFELPIELIGSEFQKNVWNALLDIPYGDTMTYKDIAEITGNPQAARAVGGACNKNPIIIVVPCHRVIGAKGDLLGFACGVDVKNKLLRLETGNIT